ncbi:MAG: hypothetical protein GY930_16570 [bacterium]|nr:hypothetical protein [bacterium]
MIITCPACKAQAKLPDSKEGAKVRCGECGRVYKALGAGRGSKGAQKTDPTRYFIIGGAALVLLILIVLVKNTPEEAPPVEEPPKVAEVKEKEKVGWDAPAVIMATNIHDLAFEKNKLMLRTKLHGQAMLDLQQVEGEKPKTFNLLSPTEQQSILDTAADDILTGDLIADWRPEDGKIVPFEEWGELQMPKDGVVVRLEVSARDLDSSETNRNVEWHLIKIGSGYKAFRWQRWLSPDEIAARDKKKRARKYEQVVLEDGSVVIEGVVRAIPHMDETPQELREEIDALIVEMTDPASRPHKLMRRLEEIGKPAIPGLLTHMANTPLETTQQAETLNLIHKTLGRITNYQTTFKVSELVGATREKQESGLKQWFGWYDRRFKRFTGPVYEDDVE